MNAKKNSAPKTGASKNSARLAAGELEILQMLWREGSVTIREAQTALALSIGYTTVQTRLERLVKKCVASKSPTRPAKYSAAVSQEQVRGTDLDLLVESPSLGVFNGNDQKWLYENLSAVDNSEIVQFTAAASGLHKVRIDVARWPDCPADLNAPSSTSQPQPSENSVHCPPNSAASATQSWTPPVHEIGRTTL